MASGGKATRSCLGWPGCPPMWRLPWPSGGGGLGGLTMSEDGGKMNELAGNLRVQIHHGGNGGTGSGHHHGEMQNAPYDIVLVRHATIP